MKAAVLLFFALFALLCAHGSNNIEINLRKPLKPDASALMQMQKSEGDREEFKIILGVDKDKIERAKKLKLAKSTVRFLCRAVNWILPGFLKLDQAFLMCGLHFSLRGFEHYMVSIPALILNSFLLHKQLMLENNLRSMTGETLTKEILMMGENEIANLKEITPMQTLLMITTPIFFDLVRWIRLQTPHIHDVPDPLTLTCCSTNFKLSKTMENLVKFYTIFIPAFLKREFFTVLLPLSFLGFDEETNFLLMFGNLFALSFFPYQNLDFMQIFFMMLTLIVRILINDMEKNWRPLENLLTRFFHK